jgi:hypothetical protein
MKREVIPVTVQLYMKRVICSWYHNSNKLRNQDKNTCVNKIFDQNYTEIVTFYMHDSNFIMMLHNILQHLFPCVRDIGGETLRIQYMPYKYTNNYTHWILKSIIVQDFTPERVCEMLTRGIVSSLTLNFFSSDLFNTITSSIVKWS